MSSRRASTRWCLPTRMAQFTRVEYNSKGLCLEERATSLMLRPPCFKLTKSSSWYTCRALAANLRLVCSLVPSTISLRRSAGVPLLATGNCLGDAWCAGEVRAERAAKDGDGVWHSSRCCGAPLLRTDFAAAPDTNFGVAGTSFRPALVLAAAPLVLDSDRMPTANTSVTTKMITSEPTACQTSAKNVELSSAPTVAAIMLTKRKILNWSLKNRGKERKFWEPAGNQTR
mmetsp:Transcript_70198/g.178030  ORF Transcript_70198/g.178030 Transcript_70198/m.178030 type:complete len:229 (-) Transcript_70198:46-732(-)